MKVNNIVFNKKFITQLQKLPKNIAEKTFGKLSIFEKNPFHPSLRLHKLSWKLEWMWSISINVSVRVIFEAEEDATILLVSVGNHDMYEK